MQFYFHKSWCFNTLVQMIICIKTAMGELIKSLNVIVYHFSWFLTIGELKTNQFTPWQIEAKFTHCSNIFITTTCVNISNACCCITVLLIFNDIAPQHKILMSQCWLVTLLVQQLAYLHRFTWKSHILSPFKSLILTKALMSKLIFYHLVWCSVH